MMEVTLLEGRTCNGVLSIKEGEIQGLSISFFDRDNNPLDISASTLGLVIVEKKGNAPIVSKIDSEFFRIDNFSASVNIDYSPLDVKKYTMEIELIGADFDQKSDDIIIDIVRAAN